MRYLTASYIFPISSPPLKDGVVVAEEDGTIVKLLTDKDSEELKSALHSAGAELESFKGVICPGFINTHCHLELSHLKGKFTPGEGLPQFLRQVNGQRTASAEEILGAAEKADAEMVANGIVAVGDISNRVDTFELKTKSKIRYHTFLELFDLHPQRADVVFDRGLELLSVLHASGLEGSLVPHAPYTVSQRLLWKIRDHAYANEEILCIHNQETAGENQMFLEGKGPLYDFLLKATPLYADWKPTGFHSLPSVFVHLPNCNKIQFVHNTFTQADDINWAQLYSMLVWWCLCPNANLFIENRLPDVPLFMNHAGKITIGTDSYASNWSLSVLDELKTIGKNYPALSLDTLLGWATLNGAEFLGMHRQLGSLEPGKKPGINLLQRLDTNSFPLRLSENTLVIPLL